MHKDILTNIQELAGRELHNPWQVDFEASMIGANREVVSGSSFHLFLPDEGHRKVDSLGFPRYPHYLEFRRVMAWCSLAFLPLPIAERGFDSSCRSHMNSASFTLLSGLMSARTVLQAATPKLRSGFSTSLLEHHFAISIGGANDNKSDSSPPAVVPP